MFFYIINVIQFSSYTKQRMTANTIVSSLM